MKRLNDWYLALYLMYMIGTLVAGLFATAVFGWNIMRPAMIASIFVPFIPIGISAWRARKGVK